MDRPGVGVAVIVMRGNKVLLGRRKNAHGDGTWQFPGGHLEINESWEQCAKREALEETGLEVNNLRFASVTNDIFHKEGKHYITIFMLADYVEGEAQVMEIDKCDSWSWFEWAKWPEPSFLPPENLLKQGFNPFKNEDR